MANNGRFEYTIGFKTDDSGLKQARKALQEIQQMTLKSGTEQGIEQYNASILEAKESAHQLEMALTKAYNVKMGSISTAALNKELDKLPLDDIHTKMKAIGPAGEAAFNKIAIQTMKTNLQIKQGSTLLNKFGKTLWRNIEWLVSGNLINTVTGVFSKAYGFTKNLDSSLNDIRIVTGQSADEMARFGKEAQETAAKLGKGTTDITNASLIFYQQGLDQAEVDARTEVTAKMSNVTKQSAETVADQMTAIWNGFQAGSDELERYADVMTAIAASTASNSQELAGSISKVASIANTTGVDMEQLSAMISTVISVTRDSPETVGTAFKTIFARINDLVEDGTDEFGVSLGRVSSHLANMGIEILNEDGTLRDLGDTLTETGEKWKSYSREQQIAIAEQMGGKRQWNQVLALFDNWDKYSDALDVARNSTGALQDQQDIYMESTEAHLQAVKTAWEGVYGEMMTSDNINTVADAMTKILETVQSVIQALGGVKPILTSVAGLMLQAFSGQVAQTILNISNNFGKMKYNVSEVAAQRELAARFNIQDDEALQRIMPHYQKILNHSKAMTKEEEEQFSQLANNINETAKERQELEKELNTVKEIINNRKALKTAYDKAGTTSNLNNEDVKDLRDQASLLTQGSFENNQGESANIGFSRKDVKYQQLQTIQGQTQNWAQDSGDIVNQLSAHLGNGASLTQDQTDATNAAIAAYSDLIEKIKELKQAYDNANETGIVDAKKTAEDVAEIEKIYKDMLQNIESADVDAQLDNEFKNIVEQVINAKSVFEGIVTPVEAGTAKLNAMRESFQKMAEDGVITEQELHKLTAACDNLEEHLDINPDLNFEQVQHEFKDFENSVRQVGVAATGELEQVLKAIPESLEENIDLAEEQLENLEEGAENLANGVGFKDLTTQFTNMFGAVTQITGAIQSLKNIGNIWDNESLTTGEKYLQTIQNVGMALPMFIGGITTLTQSLKVLTAEQTLSEIKQKTLIGLGFSEIAVKEGLTIATVKETLAQQGQNFAESVHIGLQKALKILLLPLIAVKALHAKITGAETAAQWGLNAAIEANPVGAFILLIVALGAAMTAVYLKLQKLADEGKEWAKWVALLIAPFTLVIGPIITLVKKIKELNEVTQQEKESQEKLQETFEKTTAANQEFLDTLNETEKAASQLIQNFEDYDSIYEAFQIGTKSIEEYKDALNGLINQLDLTEEEAEQLDTLLRKANVTGDYSEVDEFVQGQKEEAYGEMKGTRGKVVTAKKSVAAKDIVEQDNTMDSAILGNTKNADEIVSKAINSWAGAGLKDAISEKGIDFSKITAEDYTDIENLLTAEKQQELQDLIDNSTGAEKAYYLQLYDAIYTGRMEAINQAAADSETFSNALDSNLLKFDSSTSEAVIQKNMQEYVNQIKDNIKKANPTLSDEEIDELAWKQAVDDALLISPDAEKSITNIELFGEQTSQALTKAYGKYASTWLDEGKKIYAGVLSDEEEFANEMSQENMAKVNDQLKNVGLNLNQLGDFSDLSEDSIQNLMNSIMSGAPLSADAIEQISDEVNEADQAIAFANLDFDDLSQKGEEWYTKLKGNKVSPSDLVDNKGYNELLGQVEALGEAFDSEELNEAIDIISHPDAHDVDELANAWKATNKYIAEGDLKAPVLELDEALKDLKKNDVYKDGRHLVMTAELDVDEAEKKLDKFLDADRSVEVTIDTKMDEAAEKIKTDISDAADLAGKIGEGFTASLDDLDELSAAFPGVLDGMTVLADGSIQLSQQAVDAAAAQAQQEVNNEIDKQILKYKIQNDLLQYKKDKYDEALEAASNMQDIQYTNEENLDKDLTNLMGIMDGIKDADRAATLVAEDKLTTAQLSEWEEYYTNLSLYDKQATKDRIANINAQADADIQSFDAEEVKKRFVTRTANYVYNDASGGRVEIDGYTSKIDNAGAHDYVAKVIESIKARQAEIDKQMADNLNNIKILEAYKTSNANMWKNVDKATDATKDNTDATEDNAEAQQELLDLLNEEIDAYHDVTQQIERHTTALNRLQKAQEKATGKTLIKNLQDQMKAYQDLNNDYADKQFLRYEEAAAYRVQLEGQGVAFDENGVISNYSDILNQKQKEINADLAWYNSLSAEDQEAQKDWIESRQAEYDSLVDLIGNYDQLWNQDIPDLADEIAENIDKQVELELEIKKQIVQIEVDKGSLKRMEMELNKTLDNVQEKDLERNLAYNIQSYFTYSDEEEAKLKRYLEAKQKKDEADTSGEDLSAADLENYREALEDYNSIMQEKAKQANEIISSAFDGLNEKIERQKTQFETMSKLFEHDMNLVKLRYGDQAFEQLKTLYAAREENAKAQLSNANLALEVAQKELAAAQAKGDLDLVQAAQDKVTSALEAQRQAVIDGINAIQDTAMNTVDAIFAHLDEQVAGVSFEKMKKQWDDMEKDSADYYDAINGAYEIEKLRTNMKKAINESGSAATQKALNNLMNEEITKLQQKDKLSKYDIERANALFDIEQKRAAFREAQNNKSKMRLRRDASGNYSYQFVSDEDKVTSAMQDLADAQNQLYNIDKEAYKNNLEKMQEYYLEYQEEMKAAANASAEERQAIEDRYMERVAELQEENGDTSRNLIQDVVNDSEILTGKSIENIEDMTQAEVDALMGSVIPAWKSYLGVMSRSKDLLADMKQAGLDASQVFDTSKAKIDIEMALNGLSWDSLIEGFDPAVENIKTMTSSTDEIAQEVKNISAGVSQFIEAIKSNNFTEGLEKFVMALENGTLITPAINILPQRNAYISSDNMDTIVDSTASPMDRIITSYTQLKGEEARARRDQLIDNGVIFDADGIINNYAEIIKQKQLGLSADSAWSSSLSGEDQEIQKDWIESRQAEYDNLIDLISGYDQLWNRDIPALTNEITKIAEEKTSNDLQERVSDLIDNSMFVSETVQFLADRLSKVYSQQSEILSETMDYLHTLSTAKEKEKELQEYQPTVVNINADFPAVTSQHEIEQALDSLVARATQRAYRTVR